MPEAVEGETDWLGSASDASAAAAPLGDDESAAATGDFCACSNGMRSNAGEVLRSAEKIASGSRTAVAYCGEGVIVELLLLRKSFFVGEKRLGDGEELRVGEADVLKSKPACCADVLPRLMFRTIKSKAGRW